MAAADHLEPEATERPDDDGRIRLSVAISLKRIADKLDSFDAAALTNELTHLAWRMGQDLGTGFSQTKGS